MEVKIKKLSPCQVELKISILPERFDNFVKKAVLSLGKELKVQGFRPGKVPEQIVEQKLGAKRILFEAANLAVQHSYSQALLQEKIQAVSEPEITILKIAKSNPFVFSAKVFVLQEIKLPDYKKMASQAKRKEIEVQGKEVESALDWLKKNYSENKKEKEKVFLSDDEWAKSLGGFQNMLELKKSIRQGIGLEKEAAEQKRIRSEILDKISQASRIEIPDVLIKREKNQMLGNTKKGAKDLLGMEFGDYLKKIKKTEKELLDSFSKEAEKRIKNLLVLKEIGKKENIDVLPEDLKKETDKFLKAYQDTEQAKRNIDPVQLKLYIKQSIINEKTFQFLQGLSQ